MVLDYLLITEIDFGNAENDFSKEREREREVSDLDQTTKENNIGGLHDVFFCPKQYT